MAIGRLDEWRRPGCGEGCREVWRIVPGVSGRERLELHDPDAHEAWGAEYGSVSSVIQTGVLVVDCRLSQATVSGVAAWLTGMEWELLRALASVPGRWMSSFVVRQALFGEAAHTYSSNYQRGLIYRLREALGEGGALIQSGPRGYRLAVVPPGEHPAPMVRPQMGRWAREYDACVECGANDVGHAGRGLCYRCRFRKPGKEPRS